MIRGLFALLALAVMGACGTSQTKVFSGNYDPPPAHSRVLVMTPDTHLSLLTAAGLQEARADWSQAGRDNLAAQLQTHLEARGHVHGALDPDSAMAGRPGQIIRLHDAVGQSILAFNFMPTNLPTKSDSFEWTLGEGVQELGAQYEADYALFVTARGSYASSGRVATMVAMSILGVGIPLGGQQAFASLVDLETGHVIWFNVATAAPDEDMREPEGARQLVQRLMDEAPL